MDSNIFTKNGYKNTKPRQAISEVLSECITPISAEDIYLHIKKSGVSANLSTVYRSLDALEKMGIINKTVISDGRALFELVREEHSHQVICTKCNKMIPVDLCPMVNVKKDIEDTTQFKITGHRLEIYGTCAQCREFE